MRLSELVAPAFFDVWRDIRSGGHDAYWLAGGRGSAKSSFASLAIVAGLLRDQQIDAKLLINRVRPSMVRRGDMMSIEDVTDILGIPILGAIPDDAQIVVSTNQGEPIVGMNPFAGQAYLNICRRVLGQEVPLMDLEKGRGILSRFQGFLKRA